MSSKLNEERDKAKKKVKDAKEAANKKAQNAKDKATNELKQKSGELQSKADEISKKITTQASVVSSEATAASNSIVNFLKGLVKQGGQNSEKAMVRANSKLEKFREGVNKLASNTCDWANDLTQATTTKLSSALDSINSSLESVLGPSLPFDDTDFEDWPECLGFKEKETASK